MPETDPEDAQDPGAVRAGAILTIDLGAVQANYRRLRAELGDVACAAVVKADGYGLGAAQVAPALAGAGATRFFVAQIGEAVLLREALAKTCPSALIYVLNGPVRGAEGDFLDADLVPVLNSLADVEDWHRLAGRHARALPAALHIDTGMNRLGLPLEELEVVADQPERLDGIALRLIMSHLACAEEPDHPLNAQQLGRLRDALPRLPKAPVSLANSSGIFLGPTYHFDLARPGAALYGINPTPGRPNPMSQVVRLQGKILQVREIDAPQSVGYGATRRVTGPTRVATVAVGYADGYLRSLSNRGSAIIGGRRVAVLGRVSMDLIGLDVTGVAPAATRPGALVELIGPEHDQDSLAAEADTIGYEILTALGERCHRSYLKP